MKISGLMTLYRADCANRSDQARAKANDTEIVRDAEGTKVVPRTTPTLLERLIARSAGQALPVPKKRGRPRKGVAT